MLSYSNWQKSWVKKNSFIPSKVTMSIGIMFKIVWVVVFAFTIVFGIFLIVHGNPIKKLTTDTNRKVTDLHEHILKA